MKKKITAMILSLSLILAMAPMAVFAEGGAADPADLFKVEAQDISETSVKLEWNWDNEKLPEGFVDPEDEAVFSIYDGEDALVEDLAVVAEDNEDGYTYSEEDGYSFVVEGLEAETEYELEVRIEEEEKTIASGKTDKFTTKSAQPADVTDAEEPTEEAAEPAETAGPAKDMKKTAEGETAITLEKGEVKGTVFELKWTLSGYEGDSPAFTIQKDGVAIEGAVPEGSVEEGFSYSVTGLKPGTEYTFKVILGEDEASAEITGATKHPKVANFKAVAKGNKTNKNYLAFSWSAFTGAAKYVVTWSDDDYAEPIYEGSALKFNKVITEAGKKYSFKILAYNEAGDVISWEDGTVCSGTIPNIVVKKKSGTDTTLNLTVSIPKGNAGSYRVIVTDANKNSKKLPVIKNTGKKQTATATAKKLTAARTYKVHVYNSNGVVSKTITVKTALSNVKGFKLQSSADKVYLSWKGVSRAEKYEIVRTGGGTSKKVWTTTKKAFVDNTVDKGYTARNYTYKIRAKKESFPTSRNAATVTGDAVRTMLITITFGTTRTLTSHTGGSVTTTFNRGYTTTAVGFDAGKYHFLYNGRMYYVIRESISSASVSQLNTSRTYSAAEATKFVNDMHLSSATSHLIWVNTYTQKEYIFTGSKDHWKLVQGPWIVATGKASTPTSTGMTSIKTRSAESGVPWWNITSWFSLHGNHPSWGDLGYPKSGACVRNTNEHASWIYHNTALGTAVYVF